MNNLRYYIALCGAGLLFMVGCPDDDDDPERVTYQAELAGENEVPAVATPGLGTVSATRENGSFTVEGSFAGLTSDLLVIGGSSAHVHEGGEGENGPVIFDLEVTPGTDNRSGTFTLTTSLSADQRDRFDDGDYYVNIHTVNYPGGELRAQLTDDPEEYEPLSMFAETELDTADLPHEVETDATGFATAILREGNALAVSGRFENLSSRALEVDGGFVNLMRGAPGEAGEVVESFEVEFDDEDDMRNGLFSLTMELDDDQVDAFEAAEYFVLLYSEEYEDGELRGQLDPDPIDDIADDIGIPVDDTGVPITDVGVPDVGVEDVEDDILDEDVVEDVVEDVEDDIVEDVEEDIVEDDVEEFDVIIENDVAEEDIFPF